MKKDIAHKMVKEYGEVVTFGGVPMLKIYREVAACRSVTWSPGCKMEKRWARVTCNKCLKLKPEK
jgi:hypothetical protein